MDINSFERFCEALDQYEKAKAKRDYGAACDHLIAAIDSNPYPALYEYLAHSLEAARKCYGQDVEAARPRSFISKVQLALNGNLAKSS